MVRKLLFGTVKSVVNKVGVHGFESVL
jgi:hypothetical protein